MTIEELLKEGWAYLSGKHCSALDAELLLGAATKKSKEYLSSHPEEGIRPAAISYYRELLRERYKGVPLPYLTKKKEFFKREFKITPEVLVPRPETETLTEEALKTIKNDLADQEKQVFPYYVADIGTGSGVIAVTLAKEEPNIQVIATDKSRRALSVARTNAKKHKVVNRITFLESDLLNRIPPELELRMIVANLPYVTSDELKTADQKPESLPLIFEPQGALDGGPDGLFIIRKFVNQIKRFSALRESLNHLLLEHQPSQRQAIAQAIYEALPRFKPHPFMAYGTRWSRKEN